jgi:hypothetical protein
VESREPLWREDQREELEAVTLKEAEVEPEMPNPSYWPILTAAGVTLTWGLVMTGVWWVPLMGLAFTGFCIFSWSFEPSYG